MGQTTLPTPTEFSIVSLVGVVNLPKTLKNVQLKSEIKKITTTPSSFLPYVQLNHKNNIVLPCV